MSTPIFGIHRCPSSITGSEACVSVGGAIGCDCWIGRVVGGAVVVLVVVDVVEVVVDVVDVDVDVVDVLVVVGARVVVVVLVVVVVGATVVVVAAVVVAASTVSPLPDPPHALSRRDATSNAATALPAAAADVVPAAATERAPPFPRPNIAFIMSGPHRPVSSIA